MRDIRFFSRKENRGYNLQRLKEIILLRMRSLLSNLFVKDFTGFTCFEECILYFKILKHINPTQLSTVGTFHILYKFLFLMFKMWLSGLWFTDKLLLDHESLLKCWYTESVILSQPFSVIPFLSFYFYC